MKPACITSRCIRPIANPSLVKYFYRCRIVGTGIKCPHPSTLLKAEYCEEIIAEHKDVNESNLTTSINEAKNQVKKAVIEKVIENICTKSLAKPVHRRGSRASRNKSSTITRLDNKTNHSTCNNSNNSRKTYKRSRSYLPVRKDPLTGVSPVTNLLSRDPIMRSHLNSAKWTKDDVYSDYKSLPVLYQEKASGSDTSTEDATSYVKTANKNKKVTFINNESSSDSTSISTCDKTTITFDRRQKTKNNRRKPSARNLNVVNLPPIETSKLRPRSQNDGDGYRPLYQCKNKSKFSSNYSQATNFSARTRSLSRSSHFSIENFG